MFMLKMNGRIRVISISKIKNIMAVKKNCNENVIRALVLGVNPHSNGEFISRFINFFLEISIASIIIITESSIIHNL